MIHQFSRLCVSALFVLATLAGCGGGGGNDLAVTPGASITAQPTDQSVEVGTTASFAIAATNATSYQWQRSIDGGKNFADVASETAARLTTPVTTPADNGARYRVVVTGAVKSIGSNVATLTVLAAKKWGTRATIETDNAAEAVEPQVAFDANGNALAVWQQSDGTRYSIWSNRYVAGSGWGTAALIETDNLGGAVHPQIATDSNNNALAVWAQFNGFAYRIWSNRYTAGAGWGKAAPIQSDNPGHSDYPTIAIDPNGNALAVWVQSDRTHYSLWSNRYIAGSGWGTATLIEADDAGDAKAPKIAIDGNGNALAVWERSAGTSHNIWFNRYAAGTGWGMAAQIETGDAGDAYAPQIAIDAHGNALAIWTQSNGTRYNIWSTRYIVGAGWGSAAQIEFENTGDADVPQIAADANGNAIAVWTQFDGTTSAIWASRFTADTNWGSPTLIKLGSDASLAFPKVAFDARGNALAVWNEHHSRVTYSRYILGVGWGAAAVVDPVSATGNESTAPIQLAVDRSGNAIVVWSQLDDGPRNIMANRFQ